MLLATADQIRVEFVWSIFRETHPGDEFILHWSLSNIDFGVSKQVVGLFLPHQPLKIPHLDFRKQVKDAYTSMIMYLDSSTTDGF